MRYLWNTGNNTAHEEVNESGTFWLQVQNDCGSDTDTIQVEFVKPLKKLDLGRDTTLCTGQSYTLKVPAEYNAVQWNNGSTSHDFNVTTAGIVRVEAQEKSCFYSDSVMIEFDDVPTSLFPLHAIYLCEWKEMTLSVPSNFDSYLWQDGATDSIDIVQSPGKYNVRVTNSCGVFKDTVNIQLLTTKSFAFPNVITPNGDQKNDTFLVDDMLTDSKLEIFNRWGQQVFFAAAYQNNWDAHGLDSDVYFFLITEKYCHEHLKGWIQVLR